MDKNILNKLRNVSPAIKKAWTDEAREASAEMRRKQGKYDPLKQKEDDYTGYSKKELNNIHTIHSNIVAGAKGYGPTDREISGKYVMNTGKEMEARGMKNPGVFPEYKGVSDDDVIADHNDLAPQGPSKELDTAKQELKYRGIEKVPTEYHDLTNKQVKDHFANAKQEKAIRNVDNLSQSPDDTDHEYYHSKEEMKRRGLK